MNQRNTTALNIRIRPRVNVSINTGVSTVNPSTNCNASAMIKRHRPVRATHVVLAIGLLFASFVPLHGQVLLRSAPASAFQPTRLPRPTLSGGGVVVGSFFYATDAVNGFRHYLPVDPTNPDPVNNGILTFDNNSDSMSMGGAAVRSRCLDKTGQVAYDGNQTVWVTAYDQQKGQPGSVTFPGVHRLLIDPVGGTLGWWVQWRRMPV